MVSENLVRNSCISVSREGDFLRFVWSKSCKIQGYELVKGNNISFKDCCSSSNVRLPESLARTRSLVRQYAFCNDWDYFVTFTINPSLWDRFDLRSFYRSFSKYFNNINSRRCDGKKLLYVLIPEQHKNGAWHFHGLMSNIPYKFLYHNDNGYLDWPSLRDKFGFCSLSPIRDHVAVSYYITKYISKDLSKLNLPSGSRLVLASHGLLKASRILRVYGFPRNCGIDWQYSDVSGNYCVYTIYSHDDKAQELLEHIKNIYQESRCFYEG